MRKALICSSMPTIRWTGIPGARRLLKKHSLEDKPVFLSIGYSTCHWCHVMERESFEDEEVAALLNETFVNIKVDREERPDIDAVYMKVCQLMTQSGGWPLTIMMTPDKKPFFAATYIPKETKYGRAGMLETDSENKIPLADEDARMFFPPHPKLPTPCKADHQQRKGCYRKKHCIGPIGLSL